MIGAVYCVRWRHWNDPGFEWQEETFFTRDKAERFCDELGDDSKNDEITITPEATE